MKRVSLACGAATLGGMIGGITGINALEEMAITISQSRCHSYLDDSLEQNKFASCISSVKENIVNEYIEMAAAAGAAAGMVMLGTSAGWAMYQYEKTEKNPVSDEENAMPPLLEDTNQLSRYERPQSKSLINCCATFFSGWRRQSVDTDLGSQYLNGSFEKHGDGINEGSPLYRSCQLSTNH